MYTVCQKNCAKLFSSELRQISTNFDNFWQKDGKEAKIMQNLTEFRQKQFCTVFLRHGVLYYTERRAVSPQQLSSLFKN